jgi:hypothetical protein
MLLLITNESRYPVMIIDSNTFFEKFEAGGISTQTSYFGIVKMREMNIVKPDFYVKQDENGVYKFFATTNNISLDMKEDKDEIQKFLE